MSDSAPTTAPPAAPAGAAGPAAKKQDSSFTWFLIKLVIAVLVFRTFLFTSFMIPSESMMPRLLVGDYLFAAKWPYGYSRSSLPLDLNVVPHGRLFFRAPQRGDVIIFKHPIDRVDYVKRVIGRPRQGDQTRHRATLVRGERGARARLGDTVGPAPTYQQRRHRQYRRRAGAGRVARQYQRGEPRQAARASDGE